MLLTSNKIEDINPRWLSVKQACRYASMSRPTLMTYVVDGNIYGSLKGGKWYVDRYSIDAFFESDKVQLNIGLHKLLAKRQKLS